MNRRTALGLLGNGGVAASPTPADVDTELHLDRSIGWVFPLDGAYRVAIEAFGFARGGVRLIVFFEAGRLSAIVDVPDHAPALDSTGRSPTSGATEWMSMASRMWSRPILPVFHAATHVIGSRAPATAWQATP